MAAYGLYTHIASNKFRSMLLLAGLFVLIYVVVYAGALIAEVLEARFPQTAETQPELLGHHFTEAGLTEKAVGYWLKAGLRSRERAASRPRGRVPRGSPASTGQAASGWCAEWRDRTAAVKFPRRDGRVRPGR